VPDLTPEEHKRRGDAADAMFQEMKRRIIAEIAKEPGANKAAPATIVTTRGRKRGAADAPHLPMELPLSRKPVEREGDTYKRLKAATARRLRGE
jgi:hypothetical protein